VSGIHQFVPMLHGGDAVGRHTLRLRDLMVARGISSRIYVELIDPETEAKTSPASAYPGEAEGGDVLLYQFATASDLAPWLAGRAETLVVNYHNVTPPEFFAPWDNRLARHQARARAELTAMAPRSTLGIAVSALNGRDLVAAGFATTAVVPPAAVLTVDDASAAAGADGGVGADGAGSGGAGSGGAGGRPSGGAHWLSVGRMAPNKALEDVLLALLVTRATHDPTATLEIVGRPVIASYTAALHRLVAETGLDEAVAFTGHASDEDLSAAYGRADVLVMASGHEGFGVPLIEAMSAGLPMVVSPEGGLSEVVGDAAVVVDTRDPWALAGAVAELLGDAARRSAFVAAGRHQLVALDLASAGDRLVDLVTGLV
jgi:glycosyltransferase involved in cell wall biosynthesis